MEETMDLKSICSSLFVTTTNLYKAEEPVCGFLPKCLNKPARLIALVVAPFFDLLAIIPRMIYSYLNRTVCPANKDIVDDVFGDTVMIGSPSETETPPSPSASSGFGEALISTN